MEALRRHARYGRTGSTPAMSRTTVGLLHHTLKEILAIRLQLGFDFGEIGSQLFGHDDGTMYGHL
jgi:hypothetical protein